MHKKFGKYILFLLVATMLPLPALAQSLTIQGRVTNSAGQPVIGSAVRFRVQLYTPGTNPHCVVYDETQTLDLSASNGLFSINVGRVDPSSVVRNAPTTYSLERAISNRTVLSVDGSYCSPTVSGTAFYTPAADDIRKVVIQFYDPSFMSGFETIPEMDLNPTAYAIESRNVAGFSGSTLMRVVDTAGNPANVGAYSQAQATELSNLISGTSASYLQRSTTSGVQLPGAAPSTPAAGSIWYEAGVLKYSDGSASHTLGTGSGTVSGVSAGTGISITGTSSAPTINLGALSPSSAATNVGDGSNVPRLTVDAYGRVTAISAVPIASMLPSGASDGQFLRYNSSAWGSANIQIGDLKSTDGSNLYTDSVCTGAQTLSMDTLTGHFVCKTITSFSGSLAGDVTGTQGATVVSNVGGSSAAAVNSAATTVASATNNPTAGTLMKRGTGGAVASGDLTLTNAAGTGSTTLGAAAGTYPNFALRLPASDGSSNQVLSTNGSGQLQWVSQGGTGAVSVSAPLVNSGSNISIPAATNSVNGYLTSADRALFAGKQDSGNYLTSTTGDVVTSAFTAGSATATIQAGAVTDAKIASVGVDKIASGAGKYLTYNPNGVACASGQVLKWDSTNSRWDCGAAAGAGVETDPSVAAYAKNAPSSDFSTPSSVLTLNTVPATKGGTGLTALGTSNQILGVNSAGTGMEYKTINQGTGVTITNSAGGITISAAGTGGTVTSVGVTVPAYMTSTGGPVTSSGSIALGFGSQGAAQVFAAPNATSGAPTFRNLSIADIRNGANPFVTPTASCPAGQTLGFVSGSLDCVSYALTAAQITAAQSYVPVNKAGDTMTGALNLPANGLTVGTTQLVVAGGKLGVGVAAPATSAEFSGSIKIADGGETCGATFAGAIRYNSTNIQYCNGTAWNTLGVAGAGITSINGSTANSHTIAVGTAGTSPALVDSGSTHTINIPAASTAGVTAGTISKSDYDSFTNKLTSALASMNIFVGNSSGVATSVPVSGDLTVTNAGAFTVGKIGGVPVNTTAAATGKMLRYDGTNFTPGYVGMGDLRSKTTGVPSLGTSCNASQTLTWDSVGDTLSCQNIGIDASQISSGTIAAARLPASAQYWVAGTPATTINYGGGSVGIGSTSPAYSLDVAGTIQGQDIQTKSGYVFKSAGPAFLDSASGQYLALRPGGTEALRILSSGQVGIGVASPGSPLHVAGTGQIRMTGTSPRTTFEPAANGTSNLWNIDNNGGRLRFFREDYVASGTGPSGAERMTILDNGNVGIGTASPGSALELRRQDVDAAAYQYAHGTSANYNGVFEGISTRGTAASPSATQAGDWLSSMMAGGYGTSAYALHKAAIVMKAAETWSNSANGTNITMETTPIGGTGRLERARIDSAGNVGLGTSSPNTTLDVNGAFSVRGMAAPALSPSGQGRIYFDSTSNQFMVSQHGGAYVGLATTGSGAQTFSGPVTMNGAGTGLTVTNNASVGGNLSIGGATSITNSTASTSTSTGALTVAGGLGVAGTVNANFLAAANGAAATPSHTFTSDLTTGLWAPGSNSLGFSTNGTEKVRILSNGNVGIGTSAPTSPLHTVGGFTMQASTSTSNETIVFNNSATTNKAFVGIIGTAGDFITGSAVGDGFLRAQQNLYLAANTAGTPNLTIASATGNVGINTTNPGAKFSVVDSSVYPIQVTSSSTDAAGVEIVNSSSTRNWGLAVGGSTTGTAGLIGGKFGIADRSAGAVRLVIDTTGNVGIGTSSPTTKLDIAGTSEWPARISYDTTTNTLRTHYLTARSRSGGAVAFGDTLGGLAMGGKYDATNYAYGWNGGAEISAYASEAWSSSNRGADLAFLTVPNGTAAVLERMRITNSGNVGIGTTDPTLGDTGINSSWGALAVAGPSTAGASIAALNLASQKTTVAAGDRIGAIHFVSKNNAGTAANNYMGIIDVNTEGVGGANGFGSYMRFLTKPNNATYAENMRITSTGNVGIGTNSPTGKLSVNGRIYIDNYGFGGTPVISLAVGDTDTGLNSVADGALDIMSNSVVAMSVRGGNVGIGVTSPAAKLDIAGDVKITGGFIQQEAWITPTFQNSWLDYATVDTNWGPVGFYRSTDGRVYLRGLVRAGVCGSTIFTLPAGYRPSKSRLFTGSSADAYARIQVGPSGDVSSQTGCNNTWVSLDGISFRVVGD